MKKKDSADKENSNQKSTSKEIWEAQILKTKLEKHPERQNEFYTISNRNVKRLYTPDDISEFRYIDELGFPGEYPFTRGVQPTMYRGRIWTMRQYAGFGSAEDSNKRFRYLLKQGQTGLSVAFDLPTQMGYDSNHPLAMGEVGKVGVSIDSLKDMERLFYKIPLQEVSTSMTINSTAAILLGMYISVAEAQGADVSKLRGTIQNDVLKEYIARGTYIFPPAGSMRIITDIFEYCSKNLPKWNTISISGYHIREAGSTAGQELGFTFANAVAYLDAAKERGMIIDDFAPQITFFFNSHIDFFEEIGKFRAARRLWAKIMKERYEAKNPNSLKLRFHTQTAGSSLTAQQPENNIVRTAMEALSAVLGGTQSLHTNSMDEAVGLPSEKAVRIALRTQQILGYESGVTNSIDPFAGSYFIENITDELEGEAQDLIKRIDNMGGMVKAIENGFVQREIHESAYRFQKQIEDESRLLIGVNCFTTDESSKLQRLLIPQEIEHQQCERLKHLRTKRPEKNVEKNLKILEQKAIDSENIMPAIIDCVKNMVTLGEITESLKSIYGEYRAADLF
jgi:methylmalonyl-CoA mutase N-terminal domain/subunit